MAVPILVPITVTVSAVCGALVSFLDFCPISLAQLLPPGPADQKDNNKDKHDERANGSNYWDFDIIFLLLCFLAPFDRNTHDQKN